MPRCTDRSSGDEIIARYLRNYAHGESHTPWPTTDERFDGVVVVPAFDESDAFLQRFAQTDFACRALLILVINAPTDASEAALTRTRALLHSARALTTRRRDLADGFGGYFATGRNALRVIDCVDGTTRLPADEGVGLARKIGMDHALRLIALGRVLTPLIWSTDADASLPDNYFTVRAAPDDAAITFDFVHTGDPRLAAVQRIYDLRLRYYPHQLAVCNSRYAYQALGSALAVTAHAYAQVRGVPRRAAGEDFHLLNKLAKAGGIRADPSVRIVLDARLSARVPFGTGPGVRRLLASDDPGQVPFFLAPPSFRLLAAYLRALTGWATAGVGPVSATAVAQQLIAATATGPADWPAAFALHDTKTAVDRACAASRDPAVRRTHVHTWFDGLKTLRALHRLRDAHYPSLGADQLHADYPALVQAALAPHRARCGTPQD